MDSNLSYDDAYRELAEIAHEIEMESISVDVLAEKVKRASDLITYCQSRLRSTEDEVGKIIKQIENQTEK